MRILHAQNSPYYPSLGGGDKSNRLLLESLAARGHAVRVVARVPVFSAQAEREYLEQLEARGRQARTVAGGVVCLELNGVDLHVAANCPNFRAYFAAQIEDFRPDVILCSTDDPAQILLEVALKSEAAHVVYLVRATLALPFGPDCAFPSESKSAVLRAADGVVCVSEYVARYVREHGGIEAVHRPISLFEQGEVPLLGSFDNPFVTLINPCAVKGIDVFLGLAARLPEVSFAAVPTWGTTQRDLERLRQFSNIKLLDSTDDVDRIYAQTRILLVPSLWAEARGRVVVEAMARGIPVLASNLGGIPEAKLGVEYLLPVNPIRHYRKQLDEQMVPVAEAPPQDIEPWAAALGRLISDREHYDAIARKGRRAALDYIRKTDAGPFETYLQELLSRPRKPHSAALLESHARSKPVLERLSPEQVRALAVKLKRRKQEDRQQMGGWFPSCGLGDDVRLRVFCFPHAGGGAQSFRAWQSRMPEGVRICPANLPGREARLGEAPFLDLLMLAASAAGALIPYVEKPYVLFGHSMGAVVAFEIARWMRRERLRLPEALIVSGARSPVFRQDFTPPPDPTEEELLDELRRLEGIPANLWDHPEALRALLPTLKADAALYRRYIYEPEPPLDCPIYALGGETDPNVQLHHLERWRELTSSGFEVRVLPGGHFFHQQNPEPFLATLCGILGKHVPSA